MKKNKIISILEGSIRNKLIISFIAISLIGASSMFLGNQYVQSNTNLMTNRVLLAKTMTLSQNNSHTTYIVQSGNTLSQIAYTYGVTVSELQQWNNISNPNEIYIGQTIKIYTNSSSSSTSKNSSKTTTKSGQPSSTQNNSYTTYVVQSGNTLSQISYTYGVTVNELQQWNNILDPNEIYVGQTIKIYTNSSSSSTSKNPSKTTTKSGQPSSTKNNSYTTYIVQSGNTLSQISYTYGVTVSKLQQWNNISNPNEIYVGQILKIYSSNSSSSTSKNSNKTTTKSTSTSSSGKVSSKSKSSPKPNSKPATTKKSSPTATNHVSKESSPSSTKPLTKHTTIKSSSPSTTKKSSDQITKNNQSNTTYKEGYIYNEWNMGLGIYEEPNDNANISIMLRDSTKVKVLEVVNGFYKIEFNGNNIGYVNIGNIVFSEKLAGDPASIAQVGYMYDPWSSGAIDVYENSAQLTTPEGVLAQGTKVGYLGSSGNFDYIAFGPNYDEIAVVNSNFVTFQDPTIPTSRTVKIGYVTNETFVSGPFVQSYFEALLRGGAQVKVIGEEGGYYKIEFGNNQIGYIQTSNIVFNKSEVQNTQPISKIAYISGENEVSVYQQLNAPTPEATLKTGTKVAFLGNASSGYYYIAFGEDYSEVGIIPTKYLSFEGGTSTSLEAPANIKTSTISSSVTV